MTKGRQNFRWACRPLICIVMGLTTFNLVVPEDAHTAQYVFWANSGAGKIQRADLDGSNIADLVTGIGTVIDVAVDATNEKLYWTVENSKIQRANLDGTGVQDLVTGLGTRSFIALDVASNRLYWSEENSPGKLSRANLDGTNVQQLITDNNVIKYPKFLALDLTNNKIFYLSNETPNTDYIIRRANLDGTGVELSYIPGLFTQGVAGIAVDVGSSRIFWSGLHSGKIYRANLDGSVITEPISGQTQPMGIALDIVNAKIYWCSYSQNKIQRANIDGSGVEDVVTGLVSPYGITIATIEEASSGISSAESEQEIRDIPFRSKYVLMVLLAVLGGWLVLRRR